MKALRTFLADRRGAVAMLAGLAAIPLLAIAGAALLFGSLWAIHDVRALDARYRDLASTPAKIEEAIAFKPTLDAAHERASRTMTVEVVALLGLIGLSAFAAGGARPRA